MTGRFDTHVVDMRFQYEKVMANEFWVRILGPDGCERYRLIVEEWEQVLREIDRKMDLAEDPMQRT
jgi:hypothetical protein